MPIVWFVSQISPPMRILLVGAVVFLAAWFTLLRPKAEEVPPVTPTTTAPSTQTSPSTKPESATTTAPDPKPAEPAAIPAEELAKLPKDVARALEQRKVLVLGVIADGEKPWRPLADDDRYVRNTLRDVNRYDGGVFVKDVQLSRLATYGPLVNELGVNQTPSVVIIDRNLQGRVLTGYVDRIAINQAIADARADSIDPLISDDYLRWANGFCGRYELRTARWSLPTIPGKKAEVASMKRAVKIVRDYRRGLARKPVPAKWRGLKAHWLRVLDMREDTLRGLTRAWDAKDTAGLYAALHGFDAADVRKLDRRFDRAGLRDCAINRRS